MIRISSKHLYIAAAVIGAAIVVHAYISMRVSTSRAEQAKADMKPVHQQAAQIKQQASAAEDLNQKTISALLAELARERQKPVDLRTVADMVIARMGAQAIVPPQTNTPTLGQNQPKDGAPTNPTLGRRQAEDGAPTKPTLGQHLPKDGAPTGDTGLAGTTTDGGAPLSDAQRPRVGTDTPNAPSATIPMNPKALRDYMLDCDGAAVQFRSCRQTVTNLTAQLDAERLDHAATRKELAATSKALKGGSFWRRLKSNARWFAIGGAAGAGAVLASRH